MKKNNLAKIVFALMILTFAQHVAKGQNPDSIVWPGDVNNNGVVNQFDLLYLAAAYDLEGPPRDSVFIGWEGQAAAQNWATVEGLNAGFADCNGNGLVENADIQAIELNYGLTHDSVFIDTFSMAIAFGDTEIAFDTTGTAAQGTAGQTYTIPISLGLNNTSLENFYSLAFSIDIDTNFIDLESLSFTPDDTWINPNNSGLLSIQKKNFADATFDVALSRRNMATVDGLGTIGYINFVIIDDVPDFAPNTEVLTFRKTRVFDSGLKETYLVEGRNLTLDITNQTDGFHKNNLSIQPNPANNGICFIKGIENHPHAKVRLLDMMGREIKTDLTDNSFNVNHLPSGIYLINVSTTKGQLTEKIIINN